MRSPDSDQSPMIFAPEPEPQEPMQRANWRILIVDDDDEVHKVTQLALKNQIILDRKLCFEHAYNSREARQILTEQADFAVILLDVVMETETAGLDLVHYIRQNLSLSAPRIILRTGQPGYAPEQEVIHSYDINDYRSKTEMTQSRLITSVTTAIRSYRQINLLDQSLQGLELAIRKASATPNIRGLKSFADYTLDQFNHILGIRYDGIVIAQIGHSLSILASCGTFCDIRSVDQLSENRRLMLQEALFAADVRQEANYVCLNINHDSQPAAICLQLPHPVDNADIHLLQTFIKHLRVAYQNIILLQQLHHTAYVDDVTQLPNRAKLIRHLDQLAEQHSNHMCAALLDIEHFSDINGSLGQSFGDDTLRAVTALLKRKFDGSSVVCARINSDVFGVVGPASEVTPDALLALFESPIEINSNSIPLRIKVGLSPIGTFHKDGLGILHQCSLALKQAKRSQHISYAWFEADYETRTRERLSIVRRLRQAFNQDELELWYQPQLQLYSLNPLSSTSSPP